MDLVLIAARVQGSARTPDFSNGGICQSSCKSLAQDLVVLKGIARVTLIFRSQALVECHVGMAFLKAEMKGEAAIILVDRLELNVAVLESLTSFLPPVMSGFFIEYPLLKMVLLLNWI